MKWYVFQMEREGYKNPTEKQMQLYAKLGSKKFKALQQVGFRISYIMQEMGVPPKHGDYSRDMTFNQNMVDNLAYMRVCQHGIDTNVWYDAFMENFGDEAIREHIRQGRAFKGLANMVDETENRKLEQLARDSEMVYDEDAEEFIDDEDDDE